MDIIDHQGTKGIFRKKYKTGKAWMPLLPQELFIFHGLACQCLAVLHGVDEKLITQIYSSLDVQHVRAK